MYISYKPQKPRKAQSKYSVTWQKPEQQDNKPLRVRQDKITDKHQTLPSYKDLGRRHHRVHNLSDHRTIKAESIVANCKWVNN